MHKLVSTDKNKYLKKSGFVIRKFNNSNIVNRLRKIVKKHFSKSTNYYCKLPVEKFRKIALCCQKEMNKLPVQSLFHNSEKKFIEKLLDGDKPFYEVQAFLRVVRPINNSSFAEAVGWHRETFYSNLKFPFYTINIWFPILNVNNKNTIKYITQSHLIPDKKIIRRKVRMNKRDKEKNPTKRFSNGHKTGFLYHPKKIISGVNLSKGKERNFNFKKDTYVLFSSLLVHGMAQNYSDKIRFAMGYGIIPKQAVTNKKFDSRRLGLKKSKKTNHFVEFN